MLKLKLQNFDHLMWGANSLQKTLKLGKTEGKKRRGWQRMRLDSTTNPMDMNLGKFQETVEDKGAWCAAVHRVTESDMIKQLNNNILYLCCSSVFIHSFRVQWVSLWPLLWILYQVDCLFPFHFHCLFSFHLGLYLSFCLVLSIG